MNRESERDETVPVVPNSSPTSRYATCPCDSPRMRGGSTWFSLKNSGLFRFDGGLYRCVFERAERGGKEREIVVGGVVVKKDSTTN